MGHRASLCLLCLQAVSENVPRKDKTTTIEKSSSASAPFRCVYKLTRVHGARPVPRACAFPRHVRGARGWVK
jgi:hypothetical protein